MTWADFKLFLEHTSGINKDAIHILVGIVLQLVFAVVSRRSVTRLLPWFAVLFAQISNELIDLQDNWHNIPMQWGESAKDTILTLLLPSLILVLSRMRPELFVDSIAKAENITKERL